MAKGKLLTQEDIISEWVNLVYKGNGRGKTFYDRVTEGLKDAGLPDVKWGMETVGEKKAFFGGVKGEMHQFLKVTNPELLQPAWCTSPSRHRPIWLSEEVDFYTYSESYP